MIDEFYVVYRPIGCEDESSTDEEQAEKILCSLPADQSIDHQLLRVSMLEGLIDFTCKFSRENIQSVIMDRKLWAFMQPTGEKDLWFIAGAPLEFDSSTKSKYKQQTIFKDHRPSGSGLVEGLNRLYKAFVMFRGGIVDIVNSGMNTTEKIAQLRKKARKIRFRRQQEQLDYENIQRDNERSEENGDNSNNVERVGLKNEDGVSLDTLLKKINESNAEIETLESEIKELVHSPDYVLPALRRNLRYLTEWFLQAKELHNCCGLHGIGGMHYVTVGHPAYQSLTLVRQTIEEITSGTYKGCVILYDGQVVWSDLQDECTYSLYDFIRMQETERQRNIISEFESRKRRQMVNAAQVKAFSRRRRSISGRSSVDSGNEPGISSSSSVITEDIIDEEMCPEEWLQCQMDCRGFITADWGAVDLQDLCLGTPSKQDLTGPIWPGSARLGNTPFMADSSQPPCVEAINGLAINSHDLFMPPFFIQGSSVSDALDTDLSDIDPQEEDFNYSDAGLNVDEGRDEPERGAPKQFGRLLFYRQACFVMCILMPEVNDSAHSIGESKESSTRGSREASITNFDELLSKSERTRHASAFTFEGSKTEGDTEVHPLNLSSGYFTNEDDVISLCSMLQRGLADAVDQLLVDLGKKYRHLHLYGLQWQSVFKPTLSSSPSGNALTSRRTESYDSKNDNITVTHSHRPSLDSNVANGHLEVESGVANRNNASSRDGAIKFDTSLIVPIPKRPVISGSGLPTGVSAYYFNSCNRAAKAPGLYDRDYDPQLYWPTPVVCVAHNHGPIRPVSTPKAMSEVLNDRYLSDLLSLYRHRYPLPASLTAATLNGVLVEALNDLRENLSFKFSRTDSICTEACLRLSSANGGGMWALGRRSGSRYLFIAIEGCPNLQEMNNRVRRTVEGAFKRVVI